MVKNKEGGEMFQTFAFVHQEGSSGLTRGMMDASLQLPNTIVHECDRTLPPTDGAADRLHLLRGEVSNFKLPIFPSAKKGERDERSDAINFYLLKNKVPAQTERPFS